MRERVGHNVASSAPLNLIVSHSACSPERFVNIASLEHALVLHVARKDSRKKISL